jgi:hypothetical protein
MCRPTRQIPRHSKFAISVLFFIGVFSVGCSSSTEVKGTVKYKGTPVAGGSITLVASDGTVHSGTLGPDGSFSIPGVPTGDVRVAVVAAIAPSDPTPPKSPRGPAGEGVAGRKPREPDPGAPPAPKKGTGPVVPTEYGDPRTSGLTATIKAGEPLNIELK